MKEPSARHALSEVAGRNALRVFEVFAKETLVWEVHFHSNLLDRERGVHQQRLYFDNHQRVNPLSGRFAAHQFHHFRQVFGREAHFAAVPFNAALVLKVLRHEFDKLVEYGVGATLRLGV